MRHSINKVDEMFGNPGRNAMLFSLGRSSFAIRD